MQPHRAIDDVAALFISTHTPLTGCNYQQPAVNINHDDFYSHTPHGVQLGLQEYRKTSHTHFYSHTPHGVQQSLRNAPELLPGFLLTHPSRGATSNGYYGLFGGKISTHTPLTGCNALSASGCRSRNNFYSHTPHGVQQPMVPDGTLILIFLLTHPSRGAT